MLETSNTHTSETLTRIEHGLYKMEEKIENRFDKIDSRLWQILLWAITGFTGLLSVMAHGFKWI